MTPASALRHSPSRRRGWRTFARLRRPLMLAALGWLAATRSPAQASGPSAGRLGVAAWSFDRFAFVEAMDRTAALGLCSIEALEVRRASGGCRAASFIVAPAGGQALVEENVRTLNQLHR